MLWLPVIAYISLGALFGLWFLLGGHRRIDGSSEGASLFSRLLWLPGAVLLWVPLLMQRLAAREHRGS